MRNILLLGSVPPDQTKVGGECGGWALFVAPAPPPPGAENPSFVIVQTAIEALVSLFGCIFVV